MPSRLTGSAKKAPRIFIKVQTFTANGTYTPTPGMSFCIVEAVGGGGGAGSAVGTVSNYFSSGGGGSGGYSRIKLSAATVGPSLAVAIGAAGAGGASGGSNNGTAGGDTTLGTTVCVAKGGSASLFASIAQGSPGAAGGIAGTGDIAAAGMPGTSGFYVTISGLVAGSGNGGSSHFGGGGNGNTTGTGVNAGAYGGGGGGAYANSTASTFKGGDGSAGFMIITEYATR